MNKQFNLERNSGFFHAIWAIRSYMEKTGPIFPFLAINIIIGGGNFKSHFYLRFSLIFFDFRYFLIVLKLAQVDYFP